MVTILQSKTPNTLSCTSKNTNFYQKKIANIKTETKHTNIDRVSTSSSDKCLTTSSPTSTKIYYLPSKNNLTNSIVPTLPIDNISNYHQHYHNHNITKRPLNLSTNIKEDKNSVNNRFEILIGENKSLDSPSSSNSHEKPIEIQSFKDTIDSSIVFTPPSTTPSTPSTPSSTSSKDIDPFDESLSSIKSTLESKNRLKNSETTPSSQNNKTLTFSNSDHYTSHNLNKTFDHNSNINHPKINRSQSSDTINNNNMHSEILVTAPSTSINRKEIHKNFSSINNFDSSYISKNSSSIPKYTSKVKSALHNNHLKLSVEVKKNYISAEYKLLCLQLLEDLLCHSDAGPFLNSIEDNSNDESIGDEDDKENRMEEEDDPNQIKNNCKIGMKLVEEKTSYNLYSIQRQLSENKYKNLYGVFYDLQKMLLQCYNTYTDEDHFIHRMGKNIEDFLIEKLRDMPEKFKNELKEQCLQDYQHFKNSSKSSTKYSVLPAFLEVIALPLLLENDSELKEDWMVLEDSSFTDEYLSLSREEQIKECKKKEKEKLCIILSKNNKIKILKKDNLVVEKPLNPNFINNELSQPSSSNKKPLILTITKKRKFNHIEEEEGNESSIIHCNVTLNKIPHVNKKVKILDHDMNAMTVSSPRLLSKIKALSYHPRNRNWIIQLKRTSSSSNFVYPKNYSQRIFHRHHFLSSTFSYSNSKNNFVFYIPFEILKNSPWSNLFHHFTTNLLSRPFSIEERKEKKLITSNPSTDTISSSEIEQFTSTFLNKNKNNKENLKEDNKEAVILHKDQYIQNESELEKETPIDNIMEIDRCSSTSFNFSNDHIMDKEEMKCVVSSDVFPPTPPSSSPPSSPMNISEEDETEEVVEEKEETEVIEKKKDDENKMVVVEKDKSEFSMEKTKETSKENNEEPNIENTQEIPEENSEESDKKEVKETPEENSEESESKEAEKIIEKEKKEIIDQKKSIEEFNPLEWLESRKDSKSLTDDALNLLKKDQQESLTNYLINQQIKNIIETQILIDRLNMNNSNATSLSSLCPLNNLDMSLNNYSNLSDNSSILPSLVSNISDHLPTTISTSSNANITTLSTETTYDATNDFIDWDKVCEENYVNTQELMNFSTPDVVLPVLPSCNNSLFANTPTSYLDNFSYYEDSMYSSLLDLPSTSSSTNNPSIDITPVSLYDNINNFDKLGISDLTGSGGINPFINNSSTANLASNPIDYSCSLLSPSPATLNHSGLPVNTIQYPSKLLGNLISMPIMNGIKDPLLLGNLNDPYSYSLHGISSNARHNSRFISSTPPSASSNSTYKHHHHLNSCNLYTTATNIATSLTGASKKLMVKSNSNKIMIKPQKLSPPQQLKKTNSSTKTTTPNSISKQADNMNEPSKKIFSNNLSSTNLMNISLSSEDKMAKKVGDEKLLTTVQKKDITPVFEKPLVSAANPIDRTSSVIISKVMMDDTMPVLPIPTSDVMLSSGSNECKENFSLFSEDSVIEDSSSINNLSNDLSMTSNDDFFAPSGYSYYDLFLNLNNNCNETLVSEMANHETAETLAMEEEKESSKETIKELPKESTEELSTELSKESLKESSKVLSEEKFKELSKESESNHISSIEDHLKFKKEIDLPKLEVASIEDLDSKKVDNATTIKDVQISKPTEFNMLTIKKEEPMKEDSKRTTEEEKNIEFDKPKPKITISLDLSHKNLRKIDEDENENEEEEEEEEEEYMDQDIMEEEEYMDQDIEEEDDVFSAMEEDSEEELEDDECSEEETIIAEEEEENRNVFDIGEDTEEEINDEESEKEEENELEDFINGEEEGEEEEEEDDEELTLSLMDRKRKQQQNQKKTSRSTIRVKSNVKITSSIPKIIVHTKREMEKNYIEPESHEFVDVQQITMDDVLENVFDIDSLTPEVLAKIKKTVLNQPEKPKEKIMSLASLGVLSNKNNINKKEKIVNLTKLVKKENKERKLNVVKPSPVVRTKKVRGRNALKVQVLTETNLSKTNNFITTTPTRGKGRPKGHCGRPRKKWNIEPPEIIDNTKNDFFSANKENKDNKFMVEENGKTLYIRPESTEKSPETVITQVSVTASNSIDPITVITTTVPSSIITSTRNSHFYSSSPKQCTYCGSTSTPLWRHGPPESPRLCNSCGVKWKRGKILQSQPSGFPWNSISVDKKTEEFRSLMRCITSEKVLKVLGILKTCMTIAMKRQLDRGEEVKIDIRNIDSRAWSQLYRYIKCQS